MYFGTCSIREILPCVIVMVWWCQQLKWVMLTKGVLWRVLVGVVRHTCQYVSFLDVESSLQEIRAKMEIQVLELQPYPCSPYTSCVMLTVHLKLESFTNGKEIEWYHEKQMCRPYSKPFLDTKTSQVRNWRCKLTVKSTHCSCRRQFGSHHAHQEANDSLSSSSKEYDILSGLLQDSCACFHPFWIFQNYKNIILKNHVGNLEWFVCYMLNFIQRNIKSSHG